MTMLWTDGNGNWTDDVRTARNGNYYNPSARELYDYIEKETDKADSWDVVDSDAYDQLAYYCGRDIGDYDNREDLMDDCLLSIKKEEEK